MVPNMETRRTAYPLLLGVLLIAGLSTPVRGETPADARVICVYDPAGKAGDYYAMLEDFAVTASTWGVPVSVRAYTDEQTATKDYDAGQCDGVVATGVRLQGYNNFPSTIEAMGAIPTYDILKQMILSLNRYESAARRLRRGEHETAGIIPIGAVYLFVRDRRIDTVPELAGIRIATMTYDRASPLMVDRVGAIAVPADLSTIGPKFNNGDVDACYVSAPAYEPFELRRGMGTKGGVIQYPLAQATLQLLIRHARFPEGFAAKARVDIAARFDHALEIVKRAEAAIPASAWIPVSSSDIPGFEELFLSVRLKLRDEVGAYDPTMLSALRKLRCANDPTRSECAEKKE